MSGNTQWQMSLDHYNKIIFQEVARLESLVDTTKELKCPLGAEWFGRVRGVVKAWNNELRISDAAYYFARMLWDEVSPVKLDQRLLIVSDCARDQQKPKSYRKTRGELGSNAANQVLGSIFEIITLSALIEAHPTLHVYPKVGSGGSDVEAFLDVSQRPLYVEMKALGHSSFDPKGIGGSHSVDSMIQQVREALDDKLAAGKQLALVCEAHPTVLLIALGYNADHCCPEYFFKIQHN